MEYVFGELNGSENLKIKNGELLTINEKQTLTREYNDFIITDYFIPNALYQEDVDVEGNTYQWYTIREHNRVREMNPILRKQYEDSIDELLLIIGGNK